MSQLLEADAACDAFWGINEQEVSRVEMQSLELEQDLDPENKENAS
jgi:hypothetical protein